MQLAFLNPKKIQVLDEYLLRKGGDTPQEETTLIQSVRELGVVNPIIVTPLDDGTYALLSGYRRLHAAQTASLAQVPCVITDIDMEKYAYLIMSDNLERKDVDKEDIYAFLLSTIARKLKMPVDNVAAELYQAFFCGRRRSTCAAELSRMLNTVDYGKSMISTYAAFETYVRLYCRRMGLITSRMQKKTRIPTFLEKTDASNPLSLVDSVSGSVIRREDFMRKQHQDTTEKEVKDAASVDTNFSKDDFVVPPKKMRGRPSLLNKQEKKQVRSLDEIRETLGGSVESDSDDDIDGQDLDSSLLDHEPISPEQLTRELNDDESQELLQDLSDEKLVAVVRSFEKQIIAADDGSQISSPSDRMELLRFFEIIDSYVANNGYMAFRKMMRDSLVKLMTRTTFLRMPLDEYDALPETERMRYDEHRSYYREQVSRATAFDEAADFFRDEILKKIERSCAMKERQSK